MSLLEPHISMAETDISSDDVLGAVGEEGDGDGVLGEGDGVLGSGAEGDDVLWSVGGEGDGVLGSGAEGDGVLGNGAEGDDVLGSVGGEGDGVPGSGAEGDSLLGSGAGGDDVLGSDGECERDHVTVVWEDDAELDYEEEMVEEAVKQTDVCEEDEVKVHATGNIEEGEVSSGEEGEIKDESDEPLSPPLHRPPSPQQAAHEATPTGRHGNLAEADQASQQSERGVSGEARDGQTEEKPPKNLTKLSETTASGVRETKIGAICRHYLQGKCSWGKECRFLHGSPDDQDLLAAKPVTEKLPPHERRMGSLAAHMAFSQSPFLPPHGPAHMRGPPERFMVPAAPFMGSPGPEFLRPPRGPMGEFPSHLGPPIEGEFERASFFLPYEPHNGPKGISEVAEESDGWYRLRTVASQWSSEGEGEGEEEEEEEEEKGRKVKDLRHKLKQKVKEEGEPESGGDMEESGLPQQWTDPWLRGKSKAPGKEQAKKRKRRAERAETYDSSTEEEEEEEEEEVTEKKVKKRHKPHSESTLEGKRKTKRYKHAKEVSSEEISADEQPRERKRKPGTKKKKKKRHHSSSSSSSSAEDEVPARHHHEYPYHLPPFLPPHHHLPPPPPLPPPGLPGDRERWPPPLPHRHHPMDPYGPPLSHHGRYSERFGPPFRVYEEWRGFHRSPPPSHLGRNLPPHLRPLSPPPEREWHRHHHSHRSREGRHHRSSSGRSPGSVPIPNQSSESSSDSSPERGRKKPQVKERKAASRKSSSDLRKLSDKTLSRKEKLLHELSAINKVIERKKLKKHT